MRAAVDLFVTRDLPVVLPGQRWFAGKGRAVVGARVVDAAPLGERAWFAMVEVETAGGREVYAVPLVLREAPGGSAAPFGQVTTDGRDYEVGDALADPEVCGWLLEAFARQATVATEHGQIAFSKTAEFPRLAEPLKARRLSAEQSNTSVVYGDRLILKVLRRLAPGLNPDYEVTHFLTTRTTFRSIPVVAGAAEHRRPDGTVTTLGVLQRFVPNQGDAWRWVLEHLAALRDFVAARTRHEPLDLVRTEQLVRDFSASVLRAVRELGTVTAELHVALTADPSDPAFAPEPITAADTARWTARLASDVRRTLGALGERLPDLAADIRGRAEAMIAREAELRARLGGLDTLLRDGCAKVRVHGDYHLGQTLRGESGFVILDFEGEPARPLVERRAKQCALVDVAGMLRSLDYAVGAALREDGAPAWGDLWRTLASHAYLDGYLGSAARAAVRLVPTAPEDAAAALAVFELDKALYEIRYEMDSRPAWLAIPLTGLERLLDRPRR